MNLISNIIYRSRHNNNLNILTVPTHERADSNLCSAFPEHTFYGLYLPGLKTWNHTFAKCPQNYILLEDGKIPSHVNIDAIISHHKFGQFQQLAAYAHRYQVPVISLEHTHAGAVPNVSKRMLSDLKQLKGNVNLFITGESRDSWGWSPKEAGVIEHAINCELFKPNPSVVKEKYILSVCNQFSRPVRWLPCGFPLWEKVIKGFPWHHLGADDPGFSLPAKSTEDLAFEYQKAPIFINTTQFSPIPMALLEAAASELAIISSATCEIPKIFTHGHDALLSNNVDELRYFCDILLKDELLRKKLGANARKTVQNRFNMGRFTQGWDFVFDTVRNFW